jgi:hypothetical protein
MTEQCDGLPVLVIDGASFSDFEGFTREFSRLLTNHTWHGISMPSTTCSEEGSALPTADGC